MRHYYMLIERDPLTLTVVLLGYWWLVTWGYSWHVAWHFGILIDILHDMCESDDMTSARAVKVGQSLSKIERPPIYKLAYDNGLKKICHLRHR